MSDRYMGDNTRLIYELGHYLNYNNLPRLLVCIEFENDFDSIDWIFMIKGLNAFGFCLDICQWIYTFYNKIISTVIVNRQLHRSSLTKEDAVKVIQFRPICFCYA